MRIEVGYYSSYFRHFLFNMINFAIKKISIDKVGTLTIIINNDTNDLMFLSKQFSEIIKHSNIKQAVNRLLSKSEYNVFCKSKDKDIFNFLYSKGVLSNKAQKLQLININGLLKLINNSQKAIDKENIINSLKENNLIKNDFLYLKQRKEIQFAEILIPFLNKLGYKVETQYYINDRYRLDFYIKDFNLCIEYDENEHKYRLEEDSNRDIYLKKMGINTIRINEDHNYGQFLAEILIEIENIKKNKITFVEKLKSEGYTVNNIVYEFDDKSKIPF